MTGFLDDLARAARTLRRAPVFTMACAVTLGVGIGAATAIFSVADPVILRPLPYGSPDRVDIVSQGAPGPRRSSRLGYETIADIRDQSRTLERVAAISDWQPILVRDGSAAILSGLSVSADYFATLGVTPEMGRDFRAEEDVPNADGVVILSHALWASRFGGDSSLVGRQVDFGTRKVTVAGVMPAGFEDVLQPGTQIWRALRYDRGLPYACRTCQHLRMIARRRPGVTEAQAEAELGVISSRLVAQYPKEYESPGFGLEQLQHAVVRPVAPALAALLVAVALLLAIATVNVGGLQLARALQRDEEFAVRSALGAGAGRLMRLLVAEGLVLAAVASLCGWVVAALGVRTLVDHLPAGVPNAAAIHLDARAFALALGVTLAAGLTIGLIPAWHARRRALAGSLRGGRRVGGAPHRVRAALVVTEVALAVILLAGAGLLARSLSRLLGVDAGVAVNDVATLSVQVSGPAYQQNEGVWAWQERLVDLARAVPGVTSAGITSQLPLGGSFDSFGVQALDKPLDNPEHAPSADRYTVTPDFLRTMRIPVVDGRDFATADDAPAGAPVVIVSEALAQHIWPGERAVGKQVHMGEASHPWYTVVGVAGNVHHRGLDVSATEQIYIPTRRFFFSDNAVDLVVRTAGDPAAVLPALRRAALTAEPLAVITRLASMRDVVSASTAQRRLALSLFTTFAGIALLLATAGIVGALSGMVAERRREIGLRSALGATPTGIARLVVGRGLALAGVGAAAGIGIAVAGSRVIASLLFGVAPHDALTYVLVATGALAIGVAASVFPAWRAMLVDPITALRSD
ncbi:MAG TPA: ABC transporter permease [Gemmatimonadaceae bacterium]|nr:ABC transporter permease [Gemmatimonadaceae bacterium]